ncbi:DNA polymerase [Caudoviricetes sp.]|nr:DNA polymerase [Caudoviricetes sp.]
MLLQADAKQLEFVAASYLSQDQTAIKEIWDGTDQHTDNQQRFGLPSRLIAKTFVFRLIYGGSAFSYANDPNFSSIGNEPYWESIIEQFYTKYKGLKKWHETIFDTVRRDRKLVMPTGRVYNYEPTIRGDTVKWPRTKILNYPVQGLGADLMCLARVAAFNRLKNNPSVKFINTVHDSLILDINEKECYNISTVVETVRGAFEDVPKNFQKLFGKEFNLPMRVDIELGPDWGNMEKV